MYCWKCGDDNPAGYRFCGSCGEPAHRPVQHVAAAPVGGDAQSDIRALVERLLDDGEMHESVTQSTKSSHAFTVAHSASNNCIVYRDSKGAVHTYKSADEMSDDVRRRYDQAFKELGKFPEFVEHRQPSAGTLQKPPVATPRPLPPIAQLATPRPRAEKKMSLRKRVFLIIGGIVLYYWLFK